MPIELKMPALSPTMEKGTLAKWLVSEGSAIKSGEIIAEIETDKATMEFEAVDEGTVSQLLVAEGTDDVPVGTILAMLSLEGEDVPAPAKAAAPVVAEADAPTSPTSTNGIAAVPERPTPAGPAFAQPNTVELDTHANATPLARRIAGAEGIALSSITGTGPRGKIVKADLGLTETVLAQMQSAPAVTAPVATIAAPPEGVPVTTEKISGMRKTIARRLSESKQTVPHFYLTSRCNLDPLLKLRGELNAQLAGGGIKLSVNDFMIKALALALGEVPEANVQFGGDVLHRFSRADISMAVAVDGGLVTPVIRDAGALSLSAIAAKSKGMAQRARDGKLTPEDYQGGTASISNLGIFGIDEMFPVINPPQAMILGIASGIEQPWKVDGEIALATILAATASFDHRVIDGAIAARFMAAFKAGVENPMRLLA